MKYNVLNQEWQLAGVCSTPLPCFPMTSKSMIALFSIESRRVLRILLNTAF